MVQLNRVGRNPALVDCFKQGFGVFDILGIALEPIEHMHAGII